MVSRFLRLCSAVLLMMMVFSAGTAAVLSLGRTEAESSQSCLHESSAAACRLELWKPAKGSAKSISYTLRSEDYQIQKTLCDSTGTQCLYLCFEDLPYGDYILTENDSFRCHITLSRTQPYVILSLP